MFKALCKMAKGNKGFTLVEIIVVVAIIGILALILVPRLSGYTKKAEKAADTATAKTIQTAVVTLLADGTLKVSDTKDATFKVGNSTTVTDADGFTKPTGEGEGNAAVNTAIQNALRELVGEGVTHSSGGKFTVTITKGTLDVKVTY